MVEKEIGSSSLVDAIDRILDKDIVVGAWVWNLKDSAAPFRETALFIGGKICVIPLKSLWRRF